MDFKISPDDRVGATPRGRGKAAPAKARGKSKAEPKRGARVEPGFSEAGDVFVGDEREAPGGGGRGRGKAKKTRGRRERRPLTLGRIIMKLIGFLIMLGIWGAVAVAGVIAYFYFQRLCCTNRLRTGVPLSPDGPIPRPL